jgi:hypothetical protein
MASRIQCPPRLALPSYVAASIPHFVSFEVGNPVQTLPGFGSVAASGPRAVVAVIRVEPVIDVATEALRAMKPRASANEYAT